MKSKILFKSCAFSMVLLVFYLSGIPFATSVLCNPKTAMAKSANEVMSHDELQSAVISYANRFIATIGQAAFDLEEKIPTAEGRLVAAKRKVFSLSSAAEIAAGPNAGASLLDLVVMATLNRIVWEEYYRPKVFGKPATIMVDAFKKMEAEAWELAAKVMTPEQLQEFRDLILNWHSANPEQTAVDYIRFSDFGDLGRKPNLKEIQKPGGLLAPVLEATQAVDEVRRTSERAMFLLTKMQLIMGFQVELVYKKLAMQPEIDTILKDVSGFRATADRFAGLMEQLPKQVAEERKALLNAIDDKAKTIHKISAEVQATLEHVDTTFVNLQKTTSDIEQLLQGTQQTMKSANDLVGTVDTFMSRFESGESSEPSEPFDIKDYILAIEKVQATVSDLEQLVVSIDKTSTPLISGLMEEINKSTREHIDYVFWRVIQLLFIICGAGIVFFTIYFWQRRKTSG